MAQVPPPPWLTAWHAQQGTQPPEPAPPPPEPTLNPDGKRLSNGQFAPGVVQNPEGRKPGPNRATVLARALDEGKYESLIQTVINKALGGDMFAANLVMQRMHPPPRPQHGRVKFALDTTKPLSEQSMQIVEAMASGELAPEQAQIVFQCLAAHVQLVQSTEFEERLRNLEGKGRGARAVPGGAAVILPMENFMRKEQPQ